MSKIAIQQNPDGSWRYAVDHGEEVSWASFFGASTATLKLAEAKFFLEKFQEASEMIQCGIWWGEPPVQVLIGFYVSAFLSAARSITFALQNEAKQTYDIWFPQWLSTLSEDDQEILRFMNEKRVEEVHQSGARSLIKHELVVDTPVIPGYMEIAVPYLRLKNREIPLTEACVSYLGLLEDLVSSFPEHPT